MTLPNSCGHHLTAVAAQACLVLSGTLVRGCWANQTDALVLAQGSASSQYQQDMSEEEPQTCSAPGRPLLRPWTLWMQSPAPHLPQPRSQTCGT